MLRPDTRIMAVVKANGYGLGAVALATIIENQTLADWFGVAAIEEAIALRNSGIQSPILLLSEPSPDQILDLLQFQIDCVVYTEAFIRLLDNAAQLQDRVAGIHLKIDTGMNRLGCNIADVVKLVGQIQQSRGISFNGIMSHMACSDVPTHPLNHNQLARFDAVLQKLDVPNTVLRHIANSAATRHFPESHLDMVRIGIDSYVDIMSFHARVIRVHDILPGESVSYGASYATSYPTQIATISVGYADGVPRSFNGSVLINGNRCPVVGPVCMDMLMVDIGHNSVSVGDTATLVGVNGQERIALSEFASASGRITYEALTGLGQRVIREIRP